MSGNLTVYRALVEDHEQTFENVRWLKELWSKWMKLPEDDWDQAICEEWANLVARFGDDASAVEFLLGIGLPMCRTSPPAREFVKRLAKAVDSATPNGHGLVILVAKDLGLR